MNTISKLSREDLEFWRAWADEIAAEARIKCAKGERRFAVLRYLWEMSGQAKRVQGINQVEAYKVLNAMLSKK